jgi:hypothetical protein
VINTSSNHVDFQTNQPGFDIKLMNNGQEVWSAFYNQLFMQVMMEHQLAPGESMHFNAQCEGNDNQGEPLTAGSYQVVPELVLFLDNKRLSPPASEDIFLK